MRSYGMLRRRRAILTRISVERSKSVLAVRRTKFTEMVWRVHRFAYRVSGGRLGTAFNGMPVLLLTTTGRRSGEPRSVALTYFKDGDRMAVGSNAGEDRHPAWWLNLREHPEATVQIWWDHQPGARYRSRRGRAGETLVGAYPAQPGVRRVPATHRQTNPRGCATAG
jgi:deazaflavin-dependent oxidoreductase (nitroreductase family)